MTLMPAAHWHVQLPQHPPLPNGVLWVRLAVEPLRLRAQLLVCSNLHSVVVQHARVQARDAQAEQNERRDSEGQQLHTAVNHGHEAMRSER